MSSVSLLQKQKQQNKNNKTKTTIKTAATTTTATTVLTYGFKTSAFHAPNNYSLHTTLY
jgi:hypothetical protein